MLISEAAGDYRVEVEALEPAAPLGRYEIRVLEMRAPNDQDRALLEQKRVLKVTAEMLSRSVAAFDRGRYDEALGLAEESVAMREATFGTEHESLPDPLSWLGAVYRARGYNARAETFSERALAVAEKTSGSDDFITGFVANRYAQICAGLGKYEQAESLYRRALGILEKVLGAETKEVADVLNGLGQLFNEKGEYLKAQPLLERAIATLEKVFGPKDVSLVFPLNNLGLLCAAKGDYAKAESLYERSLLIRKEKLGEGHPLIATCLNNLGGVFLEKGDDLRAEEAYQQALAIRQKALGERHPLVAQSMNNLAGIYKGRREYDRAEDLYRRSTEIVEAALGPDHPTVATHWHNLGMLYHFKGEYAKAEPLYQRVLAAKEKAFGAQHPEVAASLAALAGLNKDRKNYDRAEPLYRRSLAICENSLGPAHPDVALTLSNLAVLYQAKGDVRQAVEYAVRGAEVTERNIALNLTTGSERQRLLYMGTVRTETNATVALHAQSAPQDRSARRLALLTVLRRKGRALDAAADTLGALRSRVTPEGQALIDQLSDARSRLAALVLQGLGRMSRESREAEIKRVEAQIERLEGEVSSSSAQFRIAKLSVTIEAVQAALPDDAALIEFFSYGPFNFDYTRPDQGYGPPRYVAYVLHRQGEPTWVELGPVKTIDAAVEELRGALRSPQRRDVIRLARALDEKTMQPVRRLLGRARQVFLSPEGSLNLVPFGALVDEKGRWLIQRYTFTYLTSGRDLLRLRAPASATNRPKVFADPEFGGEAAGGAARNANLQARTSARDWSELFFTRLPGTAEEASAIRAILGEVDLRMGERATEEALKQISAPKVLHIATHGFFLDDLSEPRPEETPPRSVAVQPVVGLAQSRNPLLRSGLALAGANLRKSGKEDGVLTAMEAAALDLWGTRLVVLSACDTGVGEIKTGEGVYGLRRALVIAGAESQVMTLWPVSDEATRDLMISYYRDLQAGRGRSEALRQVQLRMLGDKRRRRPYFWAAFIASGEWAPLEGRL
jgi:CHAT domain-containing protein/Tfp pilus assembly protein PilF